MKKIKNILFKLDLKGQGIVNYDSLENQKHMWNAHVAGKDNKNQPKVHTENVTLAKRNWYAKDGGVDYKLKISADCVRNAVFGYTQSPSISYSTPLFLAALASPAFISRGYVYLLKSAQGESVKRKSALNICDAEQTNDAMSQIEFFSRSGEKMSKDDSNVGNEDASSDTSIFSKETVGEIEYQSIGNIDLQQLQFVSFSKTFDRLAVEEDLFEEYSKYLKINLPSFNSKLGFYKIKESSNSLPEKGLLFSNDDVIGLIKYILTRLLSTNISRSKAFAQTSSLKIKLVEDVFKDTINSEDGWIEVTPDFINSLSGDNYEIETFFEEVNFEEAEAQEQMIKDKRASLEKEKQAIKKAKKTKTE